MIKILSVLIIRYARERLKEGAYQSINSAIHAVYMELSNELQNFMKDHQKEK